jgi:hypothetical protein
LSSNSANCSPIQKLRETEDSLGKRDSKQIIILKNILYPGKEKPILSETKRPVPMPVDPPTNRTFATNDICNSPKETLNAPSKQLTSQALDLSPDF